MLIRISYTFWLLSLVFWFIMKLEFSSVLYNIFTSSSINKLFILYSKDWKNIYIEKSMNFSFKFYSKYMYACYYLFFIF